MVIKQVIHEDQCEFISDRNTTMNLRRLAHVMHEMKDSDKPMAVVSVDIAEAFDAVEWPYLMQVDGDGAGTKM